MTEIQTRSYRPIWWALVVIGFLALSAWAYVGTRHSDHAVQQAEASGAGLGTAYDPTSGRTVGAGATPGALGTSGPVPPTVAPEVVTPPPATAPAAGAGR